MTVRVAPAVEGFDKLQKGDQVELDYYASTVLSFGPTNAAAATDGAGGAYAGQRSGPRCGGHAVDHHRGARDRGGQERGTLQITTPDGLPQTLLVRDPAGRRQLRSLSPGDTVVVTYAEPVAVGLRKGAGS